MVDWVQAEERAKFRAIAVKARGRTIAKPSRRLRKEALDANLKLHAQHQGMLK